ncbi:hypothetical protein NOCA2540112 [metagenome]|uniref:Uncharacterized protein n=1 Tax=metagenome TaxID=256318 RepID=A0A2P2CA91_9ZZZZ
MADEGGFHHDGEATMLSLENMVFENTPVRLAIMSTQHAQAGADCEPPLVEVQDERRTLFLLSSLECLELALALLKAADQLMEEHQGDGAVNPEIRSLVGEIFDGIARVGSAAEFEESIACAETTGPRPAMPGWGGSRCPTSARSRRM